MIVLSYVSLFHLSFSFCKSKIRIFRRSTEIPFPELLTRLDMRRIRTFFSDIFTAHMMLTGKVAFVVVIMSLVGIN